MAEEEKKTVKKVMIVPPPPTDGSDSVRIVMQDDPNKVIKIVTKKDVAEVALRDENVQEILTSVPHWMIRWGNFLFLGLVLMIIGIAWMVKYPDVISIPLTVEATNLDENIMYDENTSIKNFLVKENQYITKNTPILIFENEATTTDVKLLEQYLNSIVITSQEIKVGTNEVGALKLGSLQVPFAEFQAAYQAYTLDKTNKETFKNAIISYEKLHQKLQDWNQKNVVKAAVSGNVEFSKEAENYEIGDVILKIKSDKENNYFSQIISDNSQFQKIKVGQEVQVSLAVYPEHENGVLIGKINSVIWDTSLKKYIVEINFPKELKTSYGISINPNTNLSGVANIITKRKRLLERIFSNF